MPRQVRLGLVALIRGVVRDGRLGLGADQLTRLPIVLALSISPLALITREISR